jgi:hypothetical protein
LIFVGEHSLCRSVYKKKPGCGSGLIQSGSTKSMNPDPMQILIHNRALEDKFIPNVVFKSKFKLKVLLVCNFSYLL